MVVAKKRVKKRLLADRQIVINIIYLMYNIKSPQPVPIFAHQSQIHNGSPVHKTPMFGSYLIKMSRAKSYKQLKLAKRKFSHNIKIEQRDDFIEKKDLALTKHIGYKKQQGSHQSQYGHPKSNLLSKQSTKSMHRLINKSSSVSVSPSNLRVSPDNLRDSCRSIESNITKELLPRQIISDICEFISYRLQKESNEKQISENYMQEILNDPLENYQRQLQILIHERNQLQQLLNVQKTQNYMKLKSMNEQQLQIDHQIQDNEIRIIKMINNSVDLKNKIKVYAQMEANMNNKKEYILKQTQYSSKLITHKIQALQSQNATIQSNIQNCKSQIQSINTLTERVQQAIEQIYIQGRMLKSTKSIFECSIKENAVKFLQSQFHTSSQGQPSEKSLLLKELTDSITKKVTLTIKEICKNIETVKFHNGLKLHEKQENVSMIMSFCSEQEQIKQNDPYLPVYIQMLQQQPPIKSCSKSFQQITNQLQRSLKEIKLQIEMTKMQDQQMQRKIKDIENMGEIREAEIQSLLIILKSKKQEVEEASKKQNEQTGFDLILQIFTQNKLQ